MAIHLLVMPESDMMCATDKYSTRRCCWVATIFFHYFFICCSMPPYRIKSSGEKTGEKIAEIRAKTSPKKRNRTQFLSSSSFAKCGCACERFRYILRTFCRIKANAHQLFCMRDWEHSVNSHQCQMRWTRLQWMRWTPARRLFKWRRIMYTNYDWV